MSITAAFIVPHPPLILPEIGGGEEEKIRATIDAYGRAARRIAELAPDTIVVASPHATAYADYFHISPGQSASGDFGQFGHPDARFSAVYDEAFVRTLSVEAEGAGLPAGTQGERDPRLDHGTMIPLYFIDQFLRDYKLVRIGLSGLSPAGHYRLGQCIAAAAKMLNRKVILIASGDLSHQLKDTGPYGFSPEGPEFDRQVTDAMRTGDFLRFLTFSPSFCEAAAECGLRSFQIMAGALDKKAVSSSLWSYEGPFGVGYAVAAFEVTGADESRDFGEQLKDRNEKHLSGIRDGEDPYVKLARLSLETYVRTGERALMPDSLPDDMLKRQAGVFVSLKKDGRLRGCIGTILPTTDCIGSEILQNAVSAGCEDPRFGRVMPYELSQLVYSVDVLGEPEPIASEKLLDQKRYGVIVSHGRKRGLLLPNLDGVSTVQEQIDIARRKAGIGEDEPFSLERFEVVRHT